MQAVPVVVAVAVDGVFAVSLIIFLLLFVLLQLKAVCPTHRKRYAMRFCRVIANATPCGISH